MLIRAISGAVFVTLVIGAILWGPLAIFILFSFCTVVGMFELLRSLDNNVSNGFIRMQFIAIGLMAYSGFSLNQLGLWQTGQQMWFVLPAVLFLPFITVLFSKSPSPESLLANGFLSLVYVALPFALLNVWTMNDGMSYDPSFLLGGLVIIWTNDTFAYLTGRLLGKNKLFERVSPNKTWEGTIGGVIFASFAAAIFGHFHQGTYLIWAGFGAVCSVSAILGDLIESRLKRSLGVKDMGNIMPGHGGILDRFDALILAAPFGLVYIECFFR